MCSVRTLGIITAPPPCRTPSLGTGPGSSSQVSAAACGGAGDIPGDLPGDTGFSLSLSDASEPKLSILVPVDVEEPSDFVPLLCHFTGAWNLTRVSAEHWDGAMNCTATERDMGRIVSGTVGTGELEQPPPGHCGLCSVLGLCLQGLQAPNTPVPLLLLLQSVGKHSRGRGEVPGSVILLCSSSWCLSSHRSPLLPALNPFFPGLKRSKPCPGPISPRCGRFSLAPCPRPPPAPAPCPVGNVSLSSSPQSLQQDASCGCWPSCRPAPPSSP